MNAKGESFLKWAGFLFSAVALMGSVSANIGSFYVVENNVSHNANAITEVKEAIEKLEGATAFSERITTLETVQKAHTREIENQGAYGWRLSALETTVGSHERKLSDQVRDDWVGWRSRTDARLSALERSNP